MSIKEKNDKILKGATVIVGIDKSDTSRVALDFAIKEAALRGARLRIVHAWDIAPRPGLVYGQVLIACDLDWLEQDAERTVAAALKHAARLEPKLQVEGKAVFGGAAERLVDEAKAAVKDGREVLLVVGSSARGAFGLRSTAHQLLRHAPCSLTVVGTAAHEARRRQGRSRRTRPEGRAQSASTDDSRMRDVSRTRGAR